MQNSLQITGWNSVQFVTLILVLWQGYLIETTAHKPDKDTSALNGQMEGELRVRNACSMQPGNVGQAELELREDEPDRGNLMTTMDRLNTVKS